VLYPGGRESVHHGTSSPRMSFYERQTDPVGSPAVDESLLKDVYVSLLSFDKAANTASFNAWVFPLVGWIWYAIPFLVFGSLIAMWPQRKREGEARAVATGPVVPTGSP
jgi:cytochrome c-type biogenesis protein CcmF